MGKLAGLAESLTALPGLGVRVWMFVQELAELIRIYGPNTAKTLLSQAEVTQFFAVQDHSLAKNALARMRFMTYFSRCLGTPLRYPAPCRLTQIRKLRVRYSTNFSEKI